MTSKLIVALDIDNQNDTLQLIDKLDPKNCGLKVGSELFTRLGPSFVNLLIKKKFKVFLDLKFHDIPNTVANACKAAADLGVWMLNVHASGGLNMMHAAKKSLESYGQETPILIAVTVLTSFCEGELSSIGINTSLLNHVKHLARLTKEAGLDGVVCSGHEVKAIRQVCGEEFITVTPGIRLATNFKDDQSRVMTPQNAVKQGSSFIVVGRSITKAPDPGSVLSELLRSLGNL